MSLTLCVMLWAVEGRDDDLSAYEDDVLALLRIHGAHLVTRVRNNDPAVGQPTEVQVIDVPSEDALAAYMNDPERLAMSGRREACVAKTELMRVRHV